MGHSILYFLAALSLAGGAAPIARAQGIAQAPPNAQTAPASQAPAAAPSTSKKVWTNDDVGELRGESKISTFTATNGKTARFPDKSASASSVKDAKWYRDQIARLELQIPPLNGQIADLQSALDGRPMGDTKTSTRPFGVRGGDWRTELIELQAKRDNIESHISTLRDEARHRGVPAEALP
jgi:hypothetical protein